MMSSSSIAKLNNNAVASFQGGDHKDAIKSLKVAINQLLWCMQYQPVSSILSNTTSTPIATTEGTVFVREPSSNGNSQSLDDTVHQSCYFDSQTKLTRLQNCNEVICPVPIDNFATTNNRQSRDTQHMASSMYSCAMFLCERNQEVSLEVYMTIASVAVLYNLALMHHWQSIHQGKSSSLRKALDLYGTVLKMIFLKGDLPGIEMITLAVWNNMGHIHSELFQLEDARICFSQLQNLLANRVDLRDRLTKEDYQIFLLSAILQGSDLHLAPAA